MYSLQLYGKPTGSGFLDSMITGIAHRWKRNSLAIGGFWDGSFVVENLSSDILTDFYDRWLGYRLVERSYGQVSWEGIIWQLDLIQNGVNYRRTFDTEWWSNKVKAVYSYPTVEDTQQANLVYNPVANSFQDDGQDFSDWETNPAAPPAVYRISVTNDDDTQVNGYLGLAFTTTNANDSIYIYTDVSLTIAGWNGTVAGKTPISYVVSNILLSGVRQDTGWTTNDDSIELYGQREYILSLPGATPTAATALRDSYLDEYTWPRSRMAGGDITIGEKRKIPNTLEVTAKGFWHTLNWRHKEVSEVGTTSALITNIAGESEFVTAGRIDTNSDDSFVDCTANAQGMGDLIESLIAQGDASGNMWQGGVYEDRKLNYCQDPNKVEYILRNMMLYDKGNQPAIPTLLKPGFYVRNSNAPSGQQPPGASNFWDNPQVAYIDEVEFSAPNKLKLKLSESIDSITLLAAKLAVGL